LPKILTRLNASSSGFQLFSQNLENNNYNNEMKKQKRREQDAAIPPWFGYKNEKNLKQEILNLSNVIPIY